MGFLCQVTWPSESAEDCNHSKKTLRSHSGLEDVLSISFTAESFTPELLLRYCIMPNGTNLKYRYILHLLKWQVDEWHIIFVNAVKFQNQSEVAFIIYGIPDLSTGMCHKGPLQGQSVEFHDVTHSLLDLFMPSALESHEYFILLHSTDLPSLLYKEHK